MSTELDFVPLVDDAALRVATLRSPESNGCPVHVPLVLARHVAELPESQAMMLEMIEKLKRRVAAARQARRAALVWHPGPTGDGSSGVSAELYFDEGTMRVSAQASPGGTQACSLLLDANALLLFQGTLNVFIHFLNPLAAEWARQAPYLERSDVLVPEIINRDLIALVDWAWEKVESGDGAVELFVLPLADQYGRRTTLRGMWGVEQGYASWQWEFDGLPYGAYLDAEQATWLSGFITLVRMAYPDDWNWVNDGSSDG